MFSYAGRSHYNLCRAHEALKTTPAKALGMWIEPGPLATRSMLRLLRSRLHLYPLRQNDAGASV